MITDGHLSLTIDASEEAVSHFRSSWLVLFGYPGMPVRWIDHKNITQKDAEIGLKH